MSLTTTFTSRYGSREGFLSTVLLRWGVIGAILMMWEVCFWSFLQGSLFIAPPTRILLATPEVLGNPATLSALRVTAVEFVVAFALASVVGVLLGAGLGVTKRAFGPSRNLIQLAFALPQVAIYPLFILWLGVGFSSKVAFGVTHGVFPVLLGTMAATKLVDRNLIDATRTMGGGRFEVFRKVIMPSTMLDIVSALRIAASLCLLGVLLAELMVSVDGVGAILLSLSSSFQPDRLYALVAAICLAAVVVNVAIGAMERRLSRWRPAGGS